MAFDRTDPADLAALKSEVNTDPNGYGYDPSATENGVLELINLARVAITISKPNISAADVRGATTYDAYNNLSIDEQEWIRWVTGSNGVNEESVEVTPDLRLQLTDAEGNGTASIWAASNRAAMNAAMLALIDVTGSRAQQLWGFDTIIGRADWLAARDS